MKREQIEEQLTEEVVGGTIVFTPDHTMCGLNCNNQCIVNDFGAALQYIRDNKYTMKEAEMMRAMVALGYITRI